MARAHFSQNPSRRKNSIIDKIFYLNWQKIFISFILFLLTVALNWGFYLLLAERWGVAENATHWFPTLFYDIGSFFLAIYWVSSGVYTLLRTQSLKKWLTFGWHTAFIVPAFLLAIAFHNLFYMLFFEQYQRSGGDESLFFIMALLILPFYLIISLIYTVFASSWNKSVAK
jgi:hypothetical protein